MIPTPPEPAMGPNAPMKTVVCSNCGADVLVNAVYPIDAVESCKNCPGGRK